MSAPAAGNGHRNLRSFRKDKRQCTTELPIRAIPPTISPEAEHLLPLRFVEGTRRPPPQSKRAEFPAALPEKKSSKTESPRRNETEIPGKRKPKKNVQTTGAGNCRSRRKLPKQRRTRPRRRWEQERGMRGGSEGTHRLCSKAMKGRLLGFISSSSRTQRRRRRG
jgi:hypothetical protein